MFSFALSAVDPQSHPDTSARAGVWKTPHGEVSTPLFMPVGTQATVKGLTTSQLREIGAQQLLANTYHLALRPGADVVERLGGLHAVMGWDGPILTDSGGFQVFSLADLRAMTDDEVIFKSHVDGSEFSLSPERAIRIQQQLGADVIMCLDECPPSDVDDEKMRAPVDRTTRWANRCRDAHDVPGQALFGIVQGGISEAMRTRSAEGLLPLDFPGYAIGGLSVGEAPAEMYRTLELTTPLLPQNKPRYLMGVGRPQDIVEAVLRGVDFFDCVMPTRNGRNATAFTSRGIVKMRNAAHAEDTSPLDPECDCPACRHHSRGYLRHLFQAKEMLGGILLSLHNLAFYQRLMRELRSAILEQRTRALRNELFRKWGIESAENAL